jgi:hypothetical protein
MESRFKALEIEGSAGIVKKRYRMPSAKPGELLVKYGKDEFGEEDLYFCYGANGACRADSKLLSSAFSRDTGSGKSLLKELEDRGYDITTLKLSVMQKQPPAAEIGKAIKEKQTGEKA